MRYWVCISNEIFGPLEPGKLSGLKGFSPMVWACPEDQAAAGARQWKRAVSFPELAPCFFPDYPAAARVQASARPLAGAPQEARPPAPAAQAAQPPSADDAMVIASINRKLDELLRAQGRPSGPAAAAVEPLSKKIDLNETTLEQIKETLQGQDRRLHTELEPLSRKLDRTELELEDIRKRVMAGGEAARPGDNGVPVASALEQIKEAVRKQDVLIHSELGPISERVAQAENAIEEETALQRAVLEKMDALDRDLAGLKDGLALPQPTAGAPAGPFRAAALTLLIGGAGVFGAYAFSAWVLSQAAVPHPAAAPKKPAARQTRSPETFVRAYGRAMPLERAVTEDALVRGAAGEAAWSVEAEAGGRHAVGAVFQRSRGRPLYYYFSVDVKAGSLLPLNRGAERALRRADGR